MSLTESQKSRRAMLEQELKRIVEVILKNYQPQKVILFGSLAIGEVQEWSDIDLMVVMETDKPFMQRIKEMVECIKPNVGTDILVYTPKEFEELCKSRRFFQDEIDEKGRTVYEKQVA
ncbi:MAG: nucleotidyltransferase domain-containing protein [Pseudomonadota bacterium]